MVDVLPRQPVKASAKEKWVSPEVAIDPETAVLTLRVERPTSASDRGYAADCEVHLAIVVDDGVELWKCETADVGGGKLLRNGEEDPATIVSWSLPAGFFGARSGFRKRLGEGKSKYTARVEIAVLAGEFDTFVSLTSAVVPTEKIAFDDYQRKRSAELADGRSL